MTRTTNAARRRAEASGARERAAAARAAATKRERRRRLVVVGGSTVGVLAVIVALVAIGAASKPHGDTSRPDAPATLVAAVSGVPASALDAVGKGADSSPPKAVTDTALTSGGKPEVLFIGAEF